MQPWFHPQTVPRAEAVKHFPVGRGRESDCDRFLRCHKTVPSDTSAAREFPKLHYSAQNAMIGAGRTDVQTPRRPLPGHRLHGGTLPRARPEATTAYDPASEFQALPALTSGAVEGMKGAREDDSWPRLLLDASQSSNQTMARSSRPPRGYSQSQFYSRSSSDRSSQTTAKREVRSHNGAHNAMHSIYLHPRRVSILSGRSAKRSTSFPWKGSKSRNVLAMLLSQRNRSQS